MGWWCSLDQWRADSLGWLSGGGHWLLSFPARDEGRSSDTQPRLGVSAAVPFLPRARQTRHCLSTAVRLARLRGLPTLLLTPRGWRGIAGCGTPRGWRGVAWRGTPRGWRGIAGCGTPQGWRGVAWRGTPRGWRGVAGCGRLGVCCASCSRHRVLTRCCIGHAVVTPGLRQAWGRGRSRRIAFEMLTLLLRVMLQL